MKNCMNIKNELIEYIKTHFGEKEFDRDEITDPRIKKLFNKYVVIKYSHPNHIEKCFEKNHKEKTYLCKRSNGERITPYIKYKLKI